MTDFLLLETERLRLYGWRIEQLDDLVRLHGDPETARYLALSGRPWTREECTTALMHWIDLFETRRLGKMRLERKSDGLLVGRCGFGVHGPEAVPEIGFSLFPQYRGQGYATEAATALRDWYFAETDSDHFIGMADVRNTASLATLARIGMKKTHVEPDGDRQVQFHIYTRHMFDAR
jgi:RimJ/RimL family protein N-acetyltransferase